MNNDREDPVIVHMRAELGWLRGEYATLQLKYKALWLLWTLTMIGFTVIVLAC